jgi:hypothetical protein
MTADARFGTMHELETNTVIINTTLELINAQWT